MTPAALAAIKARVAALPQGGEYCNEGGGVVSWRSDAECCGHGIGYGDHMECCGNPRYEHFQMLTCGEPHADFYLNAPTDLAALLAHIRSLEAEREAEIAAAVARERERCLRAKPPAEIDDSEAHCAWNSAIEQWEAAIRGPGE